MRLRNAYILTVFIILVSSCGQDLSLKEGTVGNSTQTEQSEAESTQGDNLCSSQFAPVCGQPPMPECPSGQTCAQVMPDPKTYTNDCERKKEGASLISQGRCPESSF